MAEMTIRRFSVFSVAKMQGLLGFVIGLIIGVLYGLFFMLFGAAMSSLAPRGDQAISGGLGAVVVGVIIMIAVPVFYGVLGFIGGAIGALVYNVAAGVVGGIRFELEGVAPEYAPPPPQQWSSNAA
ncbi:MAG TPA: hypothetical protein VGN90_06035 [Pyrinomonadaceae bacterium]|jgi:lipopolysaccharide export LptBFGC system permease protein LptF|nr:hypothetical protein [Pyrinomonadaceae bacterium]